MTAAAFKEWLLTLADAEAVIPARIVLDRLPEITIEKPEGKPEAKADKLLTVKEAADRLGVKSRWMYRHADKLPFTKKLTTGTLRFSEAGIERYLKART